MTASPQVSAIQCRALRLKARAKALVTIEIINNTRGGIVMFFTEKKGNAFFGGQIQVPDAGPGADWLS